jgi:hypothetical protein
MREFHALGVKFTHEKDSGVPSNNLAVRVELTKGPLIFDAKSSLPEWRVGCDSSAHAVSCVAVHQEGSGPGQPLYIKVTHKCGKSAWEIVSRMGPGK